ncbi:MAG: CDP-alcohol phosphatidyltransferase family protein [Janthinobacterium lividum]
MSHDTLAHRLVRPLVRPLVGTPVRPNHLTVLRFVTGVAAAAAFAQGGQGPVALGAAIFLASSLLDRADGVLARLSGHMSPLGHRLDLVSDCTSNALAFCGLGWGAREGWLQGWSPLLGVLAAVGVVTLFWQVNGLGRKALPGAPGRDGQVLFDPDDAILAMPVLLWCVGATPVLLLAGTITPVLALWVSVRERG